jgi:hypothetical protein
MLVDFGDGQGIVRVSGPLPLPLRVQDLTPEREGKLDVTVTEPISSVRLFDPVNRPRDLPPMKANEAAVTVSQFGANARISTRFEERSGRPRRWTVTLDTVEVTTRLRVTIWLPKRYTRREEEHEEGHRLISETVYAQLAEKTARQVAARYLGMSLREEGSIEEAKSEATAVISKALEDISSRWLKIVLGTADRINGRFDALTDHGRKNIDVYEAVALSFEGEKVAPPEKR